MMRSDFKDPGSVTQMWMIPLTVSVQCTTVPPDCYMTRDNPTGLSEFPMPHLLSENITPCHRGNGIARQTLEARLG